MAWKKDKKLAAQGLRDLAYLPKGRCAWDCTLASLAYAARRMLVKGSPDLNAWAARHAAPAGARYAALGDRALVLWHGTSRERAGKIAAHGLFAKGGLWTTTDPFISHAYCRGRSERFATEGAVVCIVLDRDELVDGRDCEVEGGSDILRFHRGLGPEVVEYVLTHDAISFIGGDRARQPAPWPRGKFKKLGRNWVPVRKAPVRYADGATYSTVAEFARACLARMLAELGTVTAVEVFSALYAAVDPWDAVEHDDVFALIEQTCAPGRHRKLQTFRAR